MKKFFKAERGSVSIFAILIILPIFIINALFIDTIRIISAERQIESAMDSALRSTMAKFNEKLAAKGLFGYAGDQNEAKGEFESYMNDQFYKSSDLSGVFSVVNPTIESASASFDSSRNLVDLDVMEHQILESMKYQAPAQIGKELYNLVSSGLGGVSEEGAEAIENLAETYEEIFKLVKKRNAKIDEAIEELNKYITMLESEFGTIVGPAASGEKIPSSIKGMNGLVHFKDRYLELIEKEKPTKDEKQEIEDYEEYVGILEFQHTSYFNKFSGTKSKIFKPLFGSLGPVNYMPGSAKEYNHQIKLLLDSINFDGIDLSPEEREEIEKLMNLALDDEFFDEIFSNIEFLYAQFEPDQSMSKEQANSGSYSSFTVGELVDGFYKVIYEDNSSAKKIKDHLKNRESNYRNTHLKYLNEQLDVYKESKKLIDDEAFQRNEEESDTSFGALWELIMGAGNLANDQATYDELSSIIAEYNAITGDDVDELDKSGFIKEAFERFNQFMEFVGGFPNSFRDELYINEYIMANYGTSEPYELIKADSYLYENKKAEFIFYGSNIAGVNYLLFIKDIALVLFVVNLLEIVLLEGGYAGPIGFLRALVKAFTKTVQEISQLTIKDYRAEGYTLEWRPFKVSTIEMTMPLFLRLFAMMKSTGIDYNNEKLRRLQAAITFDTGVHLDNSPSYIEGHIKGKVKLWFIPGLTEFLPGDFGNVNGNVYTIDKRKVYSY